MKGIIFDGRIIPPEFHMEYKFADTRICKWNIVYIEKNEDNDRIVTKIIPVHLDDYKYCVHDEMIDFEIVDSGKSANYVLTVSGGDIDAMYLNNTYGPDKIGSNLMVGKLKLNTINKIRLRFKILSSNLKVLLR